MEGARIQRDLRRRRSRLGRPPVEASDRMGIADGPASGAPQTETFHQVASSTTVRIAMRMIQTVSARRHPGAAVSRPDPEHEQPDDQQGDPGQEDHHEDASQQLAFHHALDDPSALPRTLTHGVFVLNQYA
jgi:hypothetical protein